MDKCFLCVSGGEVVVMLVFIVGLAAFSIALTARIAYLDGYRVANVEHKYTPQELAFAKKHFLPYERARDILAHVKPSVDVNTLTSSDIYRIKQKMEMDRSIAEGN